MFNKKHLLLLACNTVLHADYTARSFFGVIPFFMPSAPERVTFTSDDDFTAENCGFNFHIVPYGSHSVCSCNLSNYFFPIAKRTLLVAENSSSQVASRDIDPRHFNIQTVNGTFTSEISIAPFRREVGAFFNIRQRLWRWNDGHARVWIDVGLPIAHVGTSTNFSEKILVSSPAVATAGLEGAPRVANMIDAFAQEEFLYGKFDNSCHSVTKLAFVDARMFWQCVRTDCYTFDVDFGFLAPTGNKATGVYVFEPIAGNGGHWEIMVGSHQRFDLTKHANFSMRVEFDLDIEYLLSACEIRSFDVGGKPWGRYMESYRDSAEAISASVASSGGADSGSFGINLYTHEVDVTPGFLGKVRLGFPFKYCHWIGDIGYVATARQEEQVSLCWREGPALKDEQGLGITTTARTIGQSVSVNSTTYPLISIPVSRYNPLNPVDLDISSATVPAVVTQTIYGSLGYEFTDYWRPASLGLGASYEFASSNAALKRWLVWLSFAVTV